MSAVILLQVVDLPFWYIDIPLPKGAIGERGGVVLTSLMGKLAMFDIRLWGSDGVLASAIMMPIDILVTANLLNKRRRNSNQSLFAWSVESPNGRPIRTASGQIIAVHGNISSRRATSAIYVASPFLAVATGYLKAENNSESLLIRALQRAHANGTMIATHCTGTFILAEAGLLRNRLATTHWARAREFTASYPDVRLDINQVVTVDGGLICGGAVTSFSNVILEIVERLAGKELAADVARYLLIDRNRGGQTAYARDEFLVEQPLSDTFVVQAKNWLAANYWRAFKLASVAKALGVSERTLNRRFKATLGVTPIKFIQSVRVESAKRLLEEGQGSAQEVSERVGYEDLATFRELFKRETGMTLKAYQTKFSQENAVERKR
jgi:transcriptional regulator GlxA family with amidase domain